MARRLLLLALVACGGAKAPAPAAPSSDAPPFRVDVSPPSSCTRGAPCEAKLVLTALAGFKVNEEYPFKFVGDARPALTFEGTGAFARADAKTGTMTVTFRADATGTVEVSGTFKLSVCTDEVCKIEQPKITFAVPVT